MARGRSTKVPEVVNKGAMCKNVISAVSSPASCKGRILGFILRIRAPSTTRQYSAGFRVEAFGFQVQGTGFREQGPGGDQRRAFARILQRAFRCVQRFRFRNKDSRFGVQDSLRTLSH